MSRLKSFLASPVDTYYEEIHTLFLRDRVEDAEHEAHQLIKKYPTHTKTYFLLAQIAWNERHYQRARERYTKVLSYDPANKKARLWKARADFECYRFEAALNEYLALYECSFGNIDYVLALWDCYQKLNLHVIAQKYYAKAVSLDPKSVKAHVWLWYEYIIDGKYGLASSAVLKAKELYYANKYQYDTGVVDNIFDLEKHVQMVTWEKPNKSKKQK